MPDKNVDIFNIALQGEIQMITPHSGAALITGASSGIGAVYAHRLAHRGYDLVLVARDQERLVGLSDLLHRETGRRIEVFQADLTTREGLARVEARLREDTTIDMLVNNAGVGTHTSLLESDVDQMSRLIDLNVMAVMRLTYAAAPGFAARGRGTLINISSIVSLAPQILNGVYGGSKAFVTAFSRSVHHELASKGVRVQAVLPGATATDFWSKGGLPVENLPAQIVMSTEDLVDAALVGLDRGELITIPSLHDDVPLRAHEAALQEMMGQLSNKTVAPRYIRK